MLSDDFLMQQSRFRMTTTHTLSVTALAILRHNRCWIQTFIKAFKPRSPSQSELKPRSTASFPPAGVIVPIKYPAFPTISIHKRTLITIGIFLMTQTRFPSRATRASTSYGTGSDRRVRAANHAGSMTIKGAAAGCSPQNRPLIHGRDQGSVRGENPAHTRRDISVNVCHIMGCGTHGFRFGLRWSIRKKVSYPSFLRR